MTKQAALVVTTYQDDSASPVHVQVKACTTDSFQESHSVDCTLDSGYALAGGGAYADYLGDGALLTASTRLSDGRTWHAGPLHDVRRVFLRVLERNRGRRSFCDQLKNG